MKQATFVLLTALLTGCATINRSNIYHGVNLENGQAPIETVEIENSGWELLKCIPIGSGNPLRPNECSCRWFTNTVTLQNNLEMLETEMKGKGATAFANLTSRNSEENFLFIILTRNAYHTSAVLIGNADKADASKKVQKQ